MEQYYHPELLRFAFVLGLVVSLAVYDHRHLTTSGIAVPGYMALAIFQPLIIPAVVASALVAHTIVRRLIARRMLLSDSTVFSLTVVTSAALHAGLDWSLVALDLIEPSSPLMRGIGYIVPGLNAHDIDRHGLRQTLTNTGAATALVACALIGAVVLDPSLARLTTSPVQDVFPILLTHLPVLILVGVVAWLGIVRRHALRCGGFVGGAVSQIGTDVDARITKLHVRLGDRVAKGDPLVELSDSRLRAERDAAAARVARFRAELDKTRAEHRLAAARDRIDTALAETRSNETAARIARERAEVALLQEQVARSEALAENGFSTQAQLDQRKSELARARADLNLRQVQQDADLLLIKRAEITEQTGAVNDAERASLAARLAQAAAALATVDARLDARTLLALDDGIVVDVPSRPGASVGTDDPILSIWDPNRTWMLGWVDQRDIERIRIGDAAQISIDRLDGVINGTVRRILVAPDGEERMLPGQPVSPLLPGASRFAIHVEFDATGRAGDILPGMSGSIAIGLTQDQNQPYALSKLREALRWSP